MYELWFIFEDVILPVFILIALGFLMQRKFRLDLYTLAKVNLYFLVPGLIFVKLYETHFSLSLFAQVLVFFVIYSVILYLISQVVSRMFRFGRGMKTAFSNSVIFYNSGNYGIPVNDLVFRHDPFALSIQVLILAFQDILMFSYGIFSLETINGGKLKAILGYFKMPVFYALVLGIGLNLMEVPIPSFLWVPANYVSDAAIAAALLTLGAQVAQLRFEFGLFQVYLSVGIRLILGPLLALAIILVWGMESVMAQALLISSAMPTAVNSAIIAQEYKNKPDFAAQTVLFSTILSAITVSIVIYLARAMF
ncbi:MAG TPA: AEC family transporter [Bacillales bacterium]|nr:AEC family transporter [Bacillales bacterium]